MTTAKPAPGRARLSIKFRMHTMSADLTGAHMSERAATLIYKIALTGKSDHDSVIEMLAELDAAAAAKVEGGAA